MVYHLCSLANMHPCFNSLPAMPPAQTKRRGAIQHHAKIHNTDGLYEMVKREKRSFVQVV
jgi:hypothetical protein